MRREAGGHETRPVEETTRLVEALRGRGAKSVKLTTYPGVGHDSWTQTYEDPALWEWLLAQRSGARLAELTSA